MKDRTKKEIAQMKMNTLGKYIQELSAKLTEKGQELDEQARHNRILRRVLWGSVALIVIELTVIIGVMK
jgi:Mn-dependent DtxR family transcriptional regulator